VTRGLDLVEAAAGADPAVVLAAAVVTLLGDPRLLFSVLALAYWLAPGRVDADPAAVRRAVAVLLALGVAALATTVGLKAALALPRPPASVPAPPADWPGLARAVYRDGVGADGFGFPSGHALGTTVAYGGAAALADVWTRRRRLLAAGTVVAAVALSRVVLSVHYLVDVLAGVAVGLVLLAGVLAAAGARGGPPGRSPRAARPDRAFAAAAVPAALAVAVTVGLGTPGSAPAEATAALGGALAGALTWRRVASLSATRVPVAVAPVALAVAGGTFAAYRLDLPLPAVLVADGVAVATVLAVPALVAGARRRR
jgi:membrane-associated phospholipid phosphatase